MALPGTDGSQYGNAWAFAALRASDGSIAAWGSASYGGSGAPTDGGYSAIYSTYGAFAALRASDGSIAAWGSSSSGGSWGHRSATTQSLSPSEARTD